MRVVLATMANFADMSLKSALTDCLCGSAWEQQLSATGNQGQVRSRTSFITPVSSSERHLAVPWYLPHSFPHLLIHSTGSLTRVGSPAPCKRQGHITAFA